MEFKNSKEEWKFVLTMIGALSLGALIAGSIVYAIGHGLFWLITTLISAI